MASAVPTEAPSPPPLEARFSALVGRPLFWFVFVGLIALFPIVRAVTRKIPPPPQLRLPLPAFVLTDQKGKPFGLDDLKGRLWAADFVFTTCPTACPKLTKRMVQIQHRSRNLGQAFHLVTFTVDPDTDTPEVLAAYAAKNHADPSRWHFLTGSLASIETTVVKGFKIAMGKEPVTQGSTLFTIFHGEKLVLVDGDGAIRGYYDADDEGVDKLLQDADILANMR